MPTNNFLDTFKNVVFAVAFAIFPFAASISCTKKQEKSPTAGNLVPFIAQDFTKGAILYGYNIAASTLTTINAAEGNQDWKLFWNEPLQQTILVDRTINSSISPSVLTAYSGTTVVGQTGRLPVNTKALIKANSDTTLAAGYTAELALIASPASVTKLLTSVVIPTGNGTSYYKNIVGLLSNGTDTWAIFGGTSTNFQKFPMATSKISLSENSFGDVNTVSGCKNVASGALFPGEGVVTISAAKAVVSCNPQYGVSGEPIAVVLLEATSAGVNATILKQSTTSSALHMYEISGASLQGKEVFVEEKSYNSTTFGYSTSKRYWLNLETKAETEITGYGGHMFYDSKSGKYLFSCFLQNGTCKAKTFAIVTPGNNVPEARTVNYEYNFSGFAEYIK